MKLIFLLIALFRIISSINHYIELNNGISRRFSKLFSNQNYYFNINLENKIFPKVKIEFTMKSDCSNPFNEVNIYEYSSYEGSKNYEYSKNYSESVLYNSNDGKLIAKLGIVAKQVYNFETRYVGFAIKPSCGINSMDTIINVYGDSKTFLSGETQNITI